MRAPTPLGRIAHVGVLEVDALVGLREEETHARVEREGANELPAQEKRNLRTITVEVAREPPIDALTVFFALGPWRLSRNHVLTRRMPAVERLGAATVLCVDGTGTLTQNQMTLRQLAVAGCTADLAELQRTSFPTLTRAGARTRPRMQ